MTTWTPKPGTTWAPKPGFDWNRVAWHPHSSGRSALCSYCYTAMNISRFEMPLTVITEDLRGAQFCADCAKTWFGEPKATKQ